MTTIKLGMCTACYGRPEYLSWTEYVKVRVGQCGVRGVAIKEVVGNIRETDLMAMRNRNIIQFYHHYGNIQVMDFADRGTLADNIDEIGDRREEIAKQISSGLVYLQGMDFVHRKIRTSNILLTRNFDAKIAGFGSDDMDCDERWMAPELRSDSPQYSFYSDIFALGMVMRKMGKGSEDYMRWMVRCLDEEPKKRPLECPIVTTEDVDPAPMIDSTNSGRLQALKSMAHKNGDVANYIGAMYRAGSKVPIDEEEALKWFLIAANLGNARAQNTMGVHYHDRGDCVAAEGWYLKAAKQGYQEAWSNFGDLLFTQDRFVEAAEWYHMAAAVNDAHAQYSLGKMYFDVWLNDTLALEWFNKAAVQGYVHAEYMMGYMYQHGRGTRPDDEKAEEWYLKAIGKGHVSAERSLEKMRHDRRAWVQIRESEWDMTSMEDDEGNLDPTKILLSFKNFSLGPEEYFLHAMEESMKNAKER